VTITRKCSLVVLALVAPIMALTAVPASAATQQKSKHHATSVHKTNAHKSTHKAKHSTAPTG
jgi:hypothetical protein